MPANHSTSGPHRVASGYDTTASAQTDAGALHPDSPEADALLESLDDAMFATIGGDAAAMDAARRLWVMARAALNRELLEESREQYLRYAVQMTRQLEADGVRDAWKATVFIEMIELLTKL